MSKLPAFQKEKVNDYQKERLEKWLFAWYQSKKTIENDEYTADGTVTDEQIAKLKTLVNPFDSDINTAEIRLLPSNLVPNSKRPYYVAIIKKWEDDLMLVAPFAPFSIPATTGELDTLKQHFSLANLQLWNTRTIPNILLKQSWLVDKMQQEECDDAFAVFANITSGKILSADLKKRIGLPIINPKDPRVEYQNNEKELLNTLQDKIFNYEKFRECIEEKNNNISFANYADKKIQFAQAANDGVIEESKCIVMNKTISDLVADDILSVVESDIDKGFIVESQSRNINPDNQSLKVVQWDLPDDLEVDGTEFVFAIDKINKILIGTGEVFIDDDEKSIDINNIHYSSINDTIKKENIVLVVIKL